MFFFIILVVFMFNIQHLEVDPEGMSIVSIDINLAEQVKGDVVPPSSEFLDLSLSARLLTTKLIAGKCQDT